jgi:hypothetical protein
METTIVAKWIKGQSPEEIAQWIADTNRRRITPVDTSRSSIERLLVELQEQDNSIEPLRIAMQLRKQAATHYARLEEILGEYRRLGSETATYETVEAARLGRIARSERLQALGKEERSLNRMLRLAGVGTTAGDRLLNARKLDLRRLEQHLVDEATVGEFVDTLADYAVELAGLPVQPDPETSAGDGESVRFDAATAVETSESMMPAVAPEAPSQQVIPYLQEPAWTLTPSQQESWSRTKRIIHRLLLAAFACNGGKAPSVKPLRAPLPPAPTSAAGRLVAEIIPLFELPDWPLTTEQQEWLEGQMKVINAWLHWFREETCREAAGWGNWRRRWTRVGLVENEDEAAQARRREEGEYALR